MTHRLRESRPALAAVAVAAACALAGCGSSSKSSTSASASAAGGAGGMHLSATERACLKTHGVTLGSGRPPRGKAPSGTSSKSGPPSSSGSGGPAQTGTAGGAPPSTSGAQGAKRPPMRQSKKMTAALKACGVAPSGGPAQGSPAA